MKVSFKDIEARFQASERSLDHLEELELPCNALILTKMAQEVIKAERSSKARRRVIKRMPVQDDERLTKTQVAQEKFKDKFDVPDETELLISYFNDVINSTMRTHKIKVEALVEEERNRIERERKEAERLKREEEERIRREEEERKRKLEEEEKAKKAREEAERKAEEEVKRKAEEEAELKVKKAEEAKAKQQAEIKIAEERKEKEKQEQTLAANKSTVFHKMQCEEAFQKYKQEISRIKLEVVEPLKQKPDLKKMINAHKRKMNPKFGQLTNSQSQLTRITKELDQLLTEGKVDPFVYNWLLNFIAKAIISQAEAEVSIKPKMAIPLAKLALNLLVLHPDLFEYLMARFVKKCPLVIGYICAVDTEDGRSKMGWKRNSEGKYEDSTQYGERLGGIMSLFAVMTRLPLDHSFVGYDPSTTRHPLPINHSWVLLARAMDAAPTLISDPHFTIVGAWWDACAKHFDLAYGKQARKLLELVSTKWVLLGKQGASRERLKMLGEDWRAGQMTELPSMEP